MSIVGYLDASSGSMLVGAIAAAGAGVAVAAKVGWRRVTGVLSPKREASPAPVVDSGGNAAASTSETSDPT